MKKEKITYRPFLIKGITFIAIILSLWGCEEIISVVDISEEEIVLLAPSENAILDNTAVTFSWEELDFVEQYQLQVATPNFDNAVQIVLDTIIGDSLQTSRNLDAILDPAPYQWRIRGLNSDFETPYSSRGFMIEIPVEEEEENLSDQTVILLSPKDNLETMELIQTLSWEALELATNYRVRITDLSDDSLFLEQGTVNVSLGVEFVVGNYLWEVRAENDTQNTLYSMRNITILKRP